MCVYICLWVREGEMPLTGMCVFFSLVMGWRDVSVSAVCGPGFFFFFFKDWLVVYAVCGQSQSHDSNSSTRNCKHIIAQASATSEKHKFNICKLKHRQN